MDNNKKINVRENDIRRAHLLFLIINAVFSVLLIIRMLRPPVWELWFIPIILILGATIWIVYLKNIFSLRARTIIIAGTSLIFLYYHGCHMDVFFMEFPLCIGLFTTACAALDEHSLTIAGILGYFFALFYHVITLHDVSIIYENYLVITVMITIFFYSRYLIGKHSNELKYFDESIERIEEERRSRENFLANVSHELRTPVNAISGMSDILLKRDLDPEVREEVYTIERAGIRLSNQIDDILDFSEIVSGNLVDESESYFFNDLIRDLKEINISLDDVREERIIWNIDSRIPAVLFGDRRKIRRVFSNIFVNALEVKKEGSVYVNIYARHEEYGINLSIAVRDEGSGISGEDIDRAYYGGFEGSSVNKQNKQPEGLKLGLAIANGLVRFMNGFMIFSSKPGEGTTVTFTIPQKIVDNELWKEESLDANDEFGVLNLMRYKILVVDDDYMNLNVVKKMLSEYGGEIKQADSGMAALELCKEEVFDLIFMDHMMPGMDGIEARKAIKTHPASKNKDTVFVALTANTVSGAREMFFSEGFFDFVSKPIDRKRLERSIQRIIRSVEPRSESVYQPKDESESLEMQETPKNAEEEKIKVLEDYGVNTKDALTYCGDSLEFYMMMLSDFKGQIDSKIAELSGYMESLDDENYKIKIHALKSNTKTLGFDEISEMSRLSEMACKEGRFPEAKDRHSQIMDKLKEIKELIDGIE